MQLIKFFILLFFTMGMVYILNHPVELEDRSIPAIGKFMNPFSGFWQNAESTEKYSNKNIPTNQLNAEVKVVYDKRNVPHIFAQNQLDALFVQGYITAQNRLWQMDISTRAAGGRLAEVLGKGKNNRILDRDRLQRRKGFLLSAEETVKAWNKNSKNLKKLDAYVAGINTYIKTLKPKEYPLEFKLLGYAPELWSNTKTALFIKTMAQTLCSRENDIEATNALNLFGKDSFDIIFPEYNPKQSPIIPTDTPWNFETTPLDNKALKKSNTGIMISEIPHTPFEKPLEGIGSNNWAVAGTKTASGNPILCNDPHLRLTMPSIWYELQIHTSDINCYGASLPGMPGVIIGFNENIAWGETNVSHDVLDWYQIKWTDENKESYWLDDKKVKTNKVVEVIKIKGGEIILDTVRYTKWGPVVYENENHPKKDLAMRWLAHDAAPEELSVFENLNAAKNYEDYESAMKDYATPAQNFVFASTEGDIALVVSGNLPLKENEQGRFVQDGSQSSNAWHGIIPAAHNPKVKNPTRGFVSSANQHSTDPDYPYYYNGSFADYRGRLINRKLDEMENITIEDMMALQLNTYGLKAEEALPLLLNLIDENTLKNNESRSYYLALKNWNYQYDKDLNAPVLFDEWFEGFHRATWDEVYNQTNYRNILSPEEWRTIDLLQKNPKHQYFDNQSTTVIETAKDIARSSFEEMCDLIKSWNDDGKKLNWASYNETNVNHMAGIPAFSINDLQVGGSKNVINAIENGAGPSWRMIVELGKKVKAYGVYPGGQSGNPGSPFYNNMIDHWANGKYYELLLMDSPEDYKDQQLYIQIFQ